MPNTKQPRTLEEIATLIFENQLPKDEILRKLREIANESAEQECRSCIKVIEQTEAEARTTVGTHDWLAVARERVYDRIRENSK